MTIKKYILPFLFLLILALSGCSKGTELGALEKNNVLDPEDTTDVFVLDSTRTKLTPTGPSFFIQLFYHIRYDLIKDTSKIYKIALYKDGALYYKLPLNHPDTYRPTDYTVAVGRYYTYTFALLEDEESASKLSAEHIVGFP